MNYYIDTSILVSALTPEPAQEPARRWLVAHPQSAWASDWVLTEFASALSVKSRLSDFNDADRARAHAGARQYARDFLNVLAVARADFQIAATYCADPTLNLRAGDALHLAVARSHGLVVMTRDRGMIGAAGALRIDAMLLEDA